jgi:BirA family biotin operon repressor/biotin-[acetyl-CoA-carboxylase] ligase
MPPPFVARVVFRDEVASTSDLARLLVTASDDPLPLLIHAALQSKGRGRGANAWWSDAGSLTFTLALDARAHAITTSHESRLALAAAVAMVETIVAGGLAAPTLGIRWPNDIETGGRKLGGILPERIETPWGTRLLIGIGLNVTTRLDDAPPDVRRMATTLADCGEPPALETLLNGWLEQFSSTIPRLARDDPTLAARWAELDTLYGQAVRVVQGARRIEGIARGIDPEGALIVGNDRETVRVFGGQVLR